MWANVRLQAKSCVQAFREESALEDRQLAMFSNGVVVGVSEVKELCDSVKKLDSFEPRTVCP